MFAPNRTRLNYLDTMLSSPLKTYDSFGFRTGKRHYLTGNAITSFPARIRTLAIDEMVDAFGNYNMLNWSSPGVFVGSYLTQANNVVGLLTFSFANHNVTTTLLTVIDLDTIEFTLPNLNIFGDGTPNENTPIIVNAASYYGYFESTPNQFFTTESF